MLEIFQRIYRFFFLDIVFAIDAFADQKRKLTASFIFCLFFAFGVFYLWFAQTHLGQVPLFYQVNYSAPVMMACGFGYHSVDVDLVPHLRDFLQVKIDYFDCSNIPADVELRPSWLWQNFYFYLLSMIGLLWKVTGVSWSGLWPYYGALSGFAALSLFYFFRLGMQSSVAFGCVVLMMMSQPMRYFFISHYYFIKAPFLFLSLYIFIRALIDDPKRLLFISYMSCLGLTLGVSLGFRRDLLILIPLFIVLIPFIPSGNVLTNLKTTLPAIAGFVLALLFGGAPILNELWGGSNSGHIGVLGLSTLFTSELHIQPSFYDWGETYNDSLTRLVINISSWIQNGSEKALKIGFHDYDIAGTNYVLEVGKNFPADFYLRGQASLINGLNHLDFLGYKLDWISYYVVIIPAILLLRTMLREAIIITVLVAYIAMYPAILYRTQDYFFIGFIAAFGIGALITIVLKGEVKKYVELLKPNGRLWRRNILIYGLLFVVAFPGAAWVLRTWQTNHLLAFLEKYQTAETEELPMVSEVEIDGKSVLTFDFFSSPQIGAEEPEGMKIHYSYLVAEFSSQNCKLQDFTATFNYMHELSFYDFTKELSVDFSGGDKWVKLYVPSFRYKDYIGLTNITMPAGAEGCLKSVSKILHPEGLPVLLFMNLREHWREDRLYMTLQ